VDLVVRSVLYGLVFSGIFTAVLVGGGLVARDFALHSYPAAIREQYGTKSVRGQRVTRVVAVLIGLSIFGVLTTLMFAVRAETGEPLDFLTAFGAAVIALMTFNVYDLVVLDWLFFNAWRPALVVLPGTEGMREYRDWRFHLAGFGKGIIIVTGIALAWATLAVLAELAF
jgi:hypothetical protein